MKDYGELLNLTCKNCYHNIRFCDKRPRRGNHSACYVPTWRRSRNLRNAITDLQRENAELTAQRDGLKASNDGLCYSHQTLSEILREIIAERDAIQRALADTLKQAERLADERDAAVEDILSATSNRGRLPQCAYCAHRDMLFIRVANRPCDNCKWHFSTYTSDNWQWRGVQQKEAQE